MTGSQLRTWRLAHDLTLKELAAKLEHDVNHTSISRWETDDNGQRQIPKWASDKLLANTQITLPLEELHQLLDLAREINLPAQQLIAQAIRAYLARHSSTASQSASQTPLPQPVKNVHAYPTGQPLSQVAEQPTAYKTGPSHGAHDPITHDTFPQRQAADEHKEP